MSALCIACIGIAAASILACGWVVAASLRRIRASQIQCRATLDNMMARGVSLERRAIAEWRP